MSIILGVSLGAIPIGLYLCGLVGDQRYFLAGVFVITVGVVFSFLPVYSKVKKENRE